MATQDDFIRTALRVPPDLHAKIHEAAAAANRTFNSEIVARLQASFESTVTAAKRSLSDREQELILQIARLDMYLEELREQQERLRDQLVMVDSEAPGGGRELAKYRGELARLWDERDKAMKDRTASMLELNAVQSSLGMSPPGMSGRDYTVKIERLDE